MTKTDTQRLEWTPRDKNGWEQTKTGRVRQRQMGVDKNKQVLMETDGQQWKQLHGCVSDVFGCVWMGWQMGVNGPQMGVDGNGCEWDEEGHGWVAEGRGWVAEGCGCT